MASKGKEISLLGVANIDFRKVDTSHTQTVLIVPLEKCNDPKAQLSASIRFSDQQGDSQETFDYDRNAFPSSGDMRMGQGTADKVIFTQNSSKTNGVTISKSQNDESRMRAIEISRRNFVLTSVSVETLRGVTRGKAVRFEGQYWKLQEEV